MDLNDYPRRQQSRDAVCLSVCLSAIPHDRSKIDSARITKRDIETFQDKSFGNPFILGSKGQRSRSRVTRTLSA